MKARVLFAGALLVASSVAHAALSEEDCATVDFSARFGPIRQQGSSEWCWASTAADLIGFAQGLTPERQVSLVDVALTGLTLTPEKVRRGGLSASDWPSYRLAESEGEALGAWRARKRGVAIAKRRGWSLYAMYNYNNHDRVCLENELPARPPFPFRSSPARPAMPQTSFLAPAEHDFLVAQLRQLGDESRSTYQVPRIQRILNSCVDDRAPPLFQQSDLFEAFNERVLEQMAENARERCRAGKPVSPMRGEVVDFQLGERSEAGRQAASWLKEKGPFSVSLPSEFFLAAAAPGSHEIVVTGMRWNRGEGRCEFTLRNSYGESCGSLRPELSGRCAEGNLWLTEEELKANARFASRIERAK